MKLIEEDELHQKFCDKLNNLDRDGFGQLPQLSEKFVENQLGEVLRYSDINKDTLKRLRNDEKLRICCMTECVVLAYTLGCKPKLGEPTDLLNINDIRNFISSDDGVLRRIECWNGPNYDYVVFGRKIETEDVKHLRLETVKVKLYQEVTDLFTEMTEYWLKEENADTYESILEDDWTSVYHLLRNYDVGAFEDYLYFIDGGGLVDQAAIGHTVSNYFSEDNKPAEIAITTGCLMNDDDWFGNNHFQFYTKL